MTESPDQKLLWFSFLKIFTRALTQINLYKADHPQVKQALDEGQSLLAQISDTLGGADFSITIDSGKLLINGTPLLTSDKLPNSLRNLYTKFRIQTITFSKGASGEDLLALCQVQAFKGEAKDFLKERGVEKITINESVYAKVEAAQPEGTVITPGSAAGGSAGSGTGAGAGAGTGNGAGPGTGTGAGGNAATEKMDEKIANQGFEIALETVVSRVTGDPAEQKRVIEILTAKFRQEIDASITRALEEVRREKKKVENDMVRTESVMTSMAGGVVVVDKEGKILMMNPEAEALSGKPLGELSGKRIVDLSSLEDQVVSLAKEIKSEDKSDISGEIQKSGSEDLAETVKKSTAIIQNEEGKIVGALSVPTDSTKFKQMEQLQKDFIANMTHELRSPLTSIKAALEILNREAAKDDGSHGILNTAIRNTERLNGIITDILDFSKLQSGKMVFHPEDVPAGDVAREAAESMKAWATSKGVSLTVTAEASAQRVYADRRRTVQILINLISNAIKFTPQGGSIELSADAGQEALSNYIFFSVKDNGCGIKKEDQEKVFEKFVQVASGEKVGGTGLGLAITKAMIIMQGGKLTLNSEPGRGTTFRVGMPLYKGQGDQPVFEQVPEAAPEAKPWWKKLLGI